MMLRRDYLKLVLGTAATSLGLLEGAAASPRAAVGNTPATVADALRSNRASAATAFVLAHPEIAAAASERDKTSLIRLIASGKGACTVRTRQQYEHAVLALLRSVERGQLEAVVLAGAGGQERLTKLVPAIRTPELREIALQVTAR